MDKNKLSPGATFPAGGGGDIITANFSGFIDEVRYYDQMLEEREIKELGGRSFLDLSGNKLHAVPISDDPTILPMSDPTSDLGLSTERPTWAKPSPELIFSDDPGALGDSFPGENHGRSVEWDNGSTHHLDLTSHSPVLAGLNGGTIAFWLRMDGVDDSGNISDFTVLSASNTDSNASFFRIMVRDIGVMQMHCVNQGIEVAKFYTAASGRLNVGIEGNWFWNHIAYVADENQSKFYVNGVLTESLQYAGGEGNKRAFFSDVENINFIGIGKHISSVETNGFRGNIDDFYIYDRALTAGEIKYLFDLKSRPREPSPIGGSCRRNRYD
jgi:hypothetical protein